VPGTEGNPGTEGKPIGAPEALRRLAVEALRGAQASPFRA
jgi:hypothetical protein